jgi:hypothetical protein
MLPSLATAAAVLEDLAALLRDVPRLTPLSTITIAFEPKRRSWAIDGVLAGTYPDARHARGPVEAWRDAFIGRGTTQIREYGERDSGWSVTAEVYLAYGIVLRVGVDVGPSPHAAQVRP